MRDSNHVRGGRTGRVQAVRLALGLLCTVVLALLFVAASVMMAVSAISWAVGWGTGWAVVRTLLLWCIAWSLVNLWSAHLDRSSRA